MPKINTDKRLITEIVTRGVAEVIERSSLEKKLQSGKPLIVKLGIDPTSPNLHLGRMVPLLKLRDFQQLGHTIVFIVGDFTAVIGDTSDKESERPMLSTVEVKKNLKTYLAQVAKVIDIKKANFVYNSKWLSKLDFREIGEQANQFSLGDFIKRENIKKRLDSGKRISLRELLYPLMQGYDSVLVKADIELGGTDQRFNLLAGRTLQTYYKQRPQDLLMTNLIEGTDGRKMSSSWGNTINLTDDAKNMFGKIMSIKDELIIPYFIHCTRESMETVKKYESGMKKGDNPRDVKLKLAQWIVAFFYGDKQAGAEMTAFTNQFSMGALPEDILIESFESNETIVGLLVRLKLVGSNSEARRLLQQGALKIDQKKISEESVRLKSGMIIQVGKRKFVKLK